MDKVLEQLAGNVARVVSTQLQRRVASGHVAPISTAAPMPIHTVFVDAETCAFLPTGTRVEFPNRVALATGQQNLSMESKDPLHNFEVHVVLDNYGNLLVTFKLRTIQYPCTCKDIPMAVCLVRGYTAYPTAVYIFFKAIGHSICSANGPAWQNISGNNNVAKSSNFAGLNDEAREWIVVGFKSMMDSFCAPILKPFEDDWRANGLPVPFPAPDAYSDALDEAVAADAAEHAAARADARNEAVARESVISVLREQLLALTAERAAQTDAVAAAALHEQETLVAIHTLQRENKALEAKLLEITQTASAAAAAAAAKAARDADGALQSLRERVGTLDHSDNVRLTLQVETERARTADAESRAAALQAEIVRVCQRSVAADREVTQARAALQTMKDAAADQQSRADTMAKELESMRKQIATLTRSGDVTQAVAVFHAQLKEGAVREQKLQEALDAKTRALATAENRLKVITDVCTK